MNILHLNRSQLPTYVGQQLRNLLPLPDDPGTGLIDVHINETLERLQRCIDDVKLWQPGNFDVLHSSQYCTFLYYLANTIWRRERAAGICTRLFLLNKALNAIDCFYEIELPEVFFIGHSVGIVLAKASYGNRLVLYQNTTVGKNHGVAPVIEDDVILYPGTAVLGRSRVRQGSVVAQGVSVVNQDTQANCVAFPGQGGRLVFKQAGRAILSDFFRSAG